MEKNRLLTIIVTYNGMKWIDRCLGSMRTSVMPSDVIVIDNGSTDGTSEHIRSSYPEVELHCSDRNLGFGKANNVGFQKALDEGYDYVYLLNQDAWVFPETYERLIHAMESSPEYGILSPMQLTASADKTDPRFARICPDSAVQEWLTSGKGTIHPVKFVMAAHWMISIECLRKTGGFSPAFSHYGEDDNMIHRAIYHGFRCGVLSSAIAVHDREMRPMSKEQAMRLKCVASMVKISNPLVPFWSRAVLQPIELLAISMRYRSLSVFKYVFALIRSYPYIYELRKQSLKSGAFLEPTQEPGGCYRMTDSEQ